MTWRFGPRKLITGWKVGLIRKVVIGSNNLGWRALVGKIFQQYFPLLIILWIIFVLYPNPSKLVISVQRIFSPDIDPVVVEPILYALPSNPIATEKAVLERIPYCYDWEVYGMPWYFPTAAEVLQNKKGDCKARAIVLASVFEAVNIPYHLNISPIHVWVEYEGKVETHIENPEVKFYQLDPETGKRLFQVPDIGLREIIDSTRQGFWDPMPGGRKALLFSGLFCLVIVRLMLARRARGEN
jgi:hypothetical protein